MKHIAIFASGNGSNAENIINHLRANPGVAEVSLIICNKPDAGVIARAWRLGVPCVVITPAMLRDSSVMTPLFDGYDIDMVVLAGFLLMVPSHIIDRYRGRIINIHPALLPRHGGKGMYGHHVHEAVVAAGDSESGITVHHVSDVCDGGDIIFQAGVAIGSDDTAEDVERKVRALEQIHFAPVVLDLAAKLG